MGTGEITFNANFFSQLVSGSTAGRFPSFVKAFYSFCPSSGCPVLAIRLDGKRVYVLCRIHVSYNVRSVHVLDTKRGA